VALRKAFGVLTAYRLCSNDPTAQPLLEAGLVLLRRMKEQADTSWMEWEGTLRGVFRCAKAVNDEGGVNPLGWAWEHSAPLREGHPSIPSLPHS